MSENRFKSGDVVQLKSGLPQMTVKEVSVNDVTCIWIYRNKKCQDTFPANTLEHVAKDSGPLGINVG